MTRLILPALLLAGALRGESEPSPRPNILLILTDDQGYGDLSAHGHPLLRTPHLDRLRSESARFSDFHVSPTCAPTRAALLTGRHEFRSGVTHTIFERERLALSATPLPSLLRSAGYATGIFGKWHLGDQADYQPGRRGFEETFIHGAGGIGQSYAGSCGDAPGNRYIDPLILHNGSFVRTKGHCTDVFFGQAGDWMERQVAAGRPFYLHLATNAPHSPYVAKPEDAARHLREGVTREEANFLGMIEDIDRNVGRLLERLERAGAARSTLVVFMTDNGTALGHRLHPAGMRGHKGSPWMGGTRVPSFWRWPGVIVPRDIPRLAAHLDFLPTVAELARIDLPPSVHSGLEGLSLAPLLRGGDPPWPDRVLVTHVGRWPRGSDPDRHARDNCAIRTQRWALVSVAQRPGQAKPWALFDLGNDPAQANDVAAGNPEVVRRLTDHHAAWWSGIRGSLVNEDAPLTGENAFLTLHRRQFGDPPSPTSR